MDIVIAATVIYGATRPVEARNIVTVDPGCTTSYDGVDHPIDKNGTVEFFDIAAIESCTDPTTGRTTWKNIVKPGERGYIYGKIDGSGKKDVAGYYFIGDQNWGAGVDAMLYRPVNPAAGSGN